MVKNAVEKKRTLEQINNKLLRTKDFRQKTELMLEASRLTFYSLPEQSADYAQKALVTARSSRHPHTILAALEQWAMVRYEISPNIDDATATAQEAVELAKKLHDPSATARLLRIHGQILTDAERYDQAEPLLEESARMAEAIGDNESLAPALGSIGLLYYHRRDFARSLEYYTRTAELYRVLGDTVRSAKTLSNIGSLNDILGDTAAAIVATRKAYAIHADTADRRGLSAASNNLGNYYVKIGDYTTALEWYTKSLEQKGESNTLSRAYTIGNIAYVHSGIGNLKEAETHYREALAICERLGSSSDAADYYCALASVVMKDGRHNQAEELLAQAHTLYRNLGLLAQAHAYYANMAAVYAHQERYPQALNTIEQAVSVSQAAARSSAMFHRISHADIFLRSGNASAAKAKAEECLAMIENEGDNTDRTRLYQLLSDIEIALDNPTKALQWYKQYHSAEHNHQQHLSRQQSHIAFTHFSNEIARVQAELQKERADTLQKELDMKKKELEVMALHLVRKNEFLHSVKDQISSEIASSSDFMKALAALIDTNAKDDRDWAMFEQQFQLVHPRFSSQLQEIAQNTLSAMELKICALVRSGLSNKDIANVLYLSTRTVESHRYNISKKLHLDGKKLSNFLSSMQQ